MDYYTRKESTDETAFTNIHYEPSDIGWKDCEKEMPVCDEEVLAIAGVGVLWLVSWDGKRWRDQDEEPLILPMKYWFKHPEPPKPKTEIIPDYLNMSDSAIIAHLALRLDKLERESNNG